MKNKSTFKKIIKSLEQIHSSFPKYFISLKLETFCILSNFSTQFFILITIRLQVSESFGVID